MFSMSVFQKTNFLIVSSVSAACSLFAATEAMPVYELEPVVVVAPNVWIPESDIYRESISSAKPVDLAAILSSKLPAAALTRKGPLAGDIVLRGFTRDNVVITVDDNQTFCACPNRMDPPAFHVSSQQIEAVSVRTGPFSVDQGGSVGGTIAVRTSPPSGEPLGRLYGYYGSFDYFATGITGGYSLNDNLNGLGGFYYQRGGVYEDGDGIRFTQLPGTNYQPQFFNKTAFEVYTAEAKAAYILSNDATLMINYAFQDAQDVLYPGLQMDSPSDTMNRASVVFQLPVELDIADEIEVSISFSHVDHDMRDSFRTSVNNMGGAFVSRGYFMRTQAESFFLSGRLEFNKVLADDAHLRYGIDIKRRYWDANNIIGNQTNDLLPDTVNDSTGVWGVYEQRIGTWAFETGTRFDLARSEANEDISFLQSVRGTNTNKRSDALPSAYGLISRDLTDALNAYAGVGFASRMPDPQERYMNLNRPMANPDWVGNPDLNPVRNLEVQSGLRWSSEHFDAQISAFHSWVFDNIYLAQLNATPTGATSYENIDARLYGISADTGWNALEHFRVEVGIAWQEGIKETRPANSTNDTLGEIPPLRARLAALVNYNEFSAKAEIQFQDDFERADPDIGEAAVDGWAVLNLAVSYRFTENFSLSAGIDNVLNETYAVSNAFVRDPFRSGVIVNEPSRFWFVRTGVEF
jgi:iron complex outermembrane recepter protein